MNYFSLIILVWNGFVFATSGRNRLVALSNSPYVLQLYRQVGNEGPPPERDPTLSDPYERKRICDDIGESGYFHLNQPVIQCDAGDLNNPLHSEIFEQIYTCKNSPDCDYEYENPYRQKEVKKQGYRIIERVFLCPFKDTRFSSSALALYYVSKEYNVNPHTEPYMAGRFVITTTEENLSYKFTMIMLAEEPARAYQVPGFHVEQYYLRLRKHVHAADSNVDPLCKLARTATNDYHYQQVRLCTIVAKSSYFENEIRYSIESNYPCSREQVSFRTKGAKTDAAHKQSYHEMMIRCDFIMEFEDREGSLYFSRAYLSNAVFVYRRDPGDSKIYLENLSSHVSIVDEVNSFAFPEY